MHTVELLDQAIDSARIADAEQPIALRPLDQQRDGLSAAEAQGREAALGLTLRHRVWLKPA